MGKLQNEDHKSLSELTGAGGAASQLLNDTKIYVTANSLNKQLSQAITDGDLSGSSAGGVNLITNAQGTSGTFENSSISTTGFSSYNDGATATPVDGTGGTATGITLSRTTTSGEFLRGTASIKFAKDAANRQGTGMSVDVALLGYNYSNLRISFISKVVSGTFANGDLSFYLYDGTNIITPQSNSLGNGSFFNQFNYFGSGVTTLRLIWHVTTTSASAYSVSIDDVIVQPATVVQGAAVSDWITYSPTGSWSTNTTYTGKYRRIGDSMECQVGVILSGAPNTATLRVDLPTGFTIDTNKLSVYSTSNGQAVGEAVARVSGADQTGTAMATINAGTGGVWVTSQGVADAWSRTIPVTWASGQNIGISFRVPITQWTSGVVLANSAIEYASNTGMGDATDTTSFYNGANGASVPTVTYTANRTKRVRFLTAISHTDTLILQINLKGDSLEWQNMPAFTDVGGAGYCNYQVQGSVDYGFGKINPVSGSSTDADIVFAQYRYPTGATFASAGGSWSSLGTFTPRWRIVKVSNILPVEQTKAVTAVYAISASTANLSFADNTNEVADFDTRVTDTHGAVTTGASWKFTAPRTGKYEVSGMWLWANNTSLSQSDCQLFKNSGLTRVVFNMSGTAPIFDTQHWAVFVVELNQGDFIDARPRQQSGGAKNTATNSNYGWICIREVV